jgi:hypothetical protein
MIIKLTFKDKSNKVVETKLIEIEPSSNIYDIRRLLYTQSELANIMNSFGIDNEKIRVIRNQQDELPSRTVCIQYPEPNKQWVGIISLKKSEKPHNLKFYKHKRTGWDHVPMDMNELVQENINSYDDIEAFIVNENIDWADKWEETSQIELKVNEIVLFRPWMFHSYSDVFGDSHQTARLLQFFFLKPKQDLTNPEVPSTI